MLKTLVAKLPKFDCGIERTSRPAVGTVILVEFNKVFYVPPIVVCCPGYYNSGHNIAENLSISDITTSSFKITVTNNVSGHSPDFYWIAISN